MRVDVWSDAVCPWCCAHAELLGVSGVPFFLFNGSHSVSGAQSVDVFVEALTRTAAREASRLL
jgi:predicted DsbA family dithiol-disulfide isomerase